LPAATRNSNLLTLDELDMAVPRARYEDLERYIEPLNAAMARYGIDTPPRIAAFVAQLAHESGDFRDTQENLNYAWPALRRIWPQRFPDDDLARSYHRDPVRIANRAYAGRHGNGDEASGDGWRFRGRGLIQVTFRANYEAYSRAIPDPSVLADPAQLAEPEHAALSAGWFWASRDLNALADAGTEAAFEEIGFRINGGWHGKEDRLENWAEARAVIVT